MSKVSLLLTSGRLWNGERWVQQVIPHGTKPRLILLDLSAAALRGRSRHVHVEDSVAAFVRRLGLHNAGGAYGPLTGFRRQLGALAAVDVRMGVYGKAVTIRRDFIAGVANWVTKADGARTPWPKEILLAQDYYESLKEHAVPLDKRAIRALSSSALALDIYCWLAHRLYRLRKPTRLPWSALKNQFGQEYRQEKVFARKFRQQLNIVRAAYPQAKVKAIYGGIELRPSTTPIRPSRITVPRTFEA